MIKTTHCKNFNHGRILVHIQYCPNCGERFNVKTDIKHCTDITHNEKRKLRDCFCCDCGTTLTPLKK